MKRKTLWFFWRCLLTASVVLVGGCHWVTGGGYSESKPEAQALQGICDKGTFKCNGEFLLECAADQKGWVKKGVCASKEQCDSKAGVCTVCPQADMLRCAGANREVCSPDRAKWNVKEPCMSADTCSPIMCGDCTSPGQLQCAAETGPDGKEKVVLKQCTTEKRWVTRSECLSDAVCMTVKSMAATDPALDLSTCMGKCTPGAVKCDGTTLYRCPADGLDWVLVGQCANLELCELTAGIIKSSPDMGATIQACEQGCGTPGKPRCTGNTLERCSDNLLSWTPVMQCPMGLQCSTNGQGSCIVCTPGEYQCNGKMLQKCSAEHVWVDEKECEQAALCKLYPDANGALVNGACEPPVCERPGTYVCGAQNDPKTPGPRLFYCNMDQTAWDPGDTCASAALCNAADGVCKPPVCQPDQRRCYPNNPLEYQACTKDLTGWEVIKTCTPGQFCNDKAPDQICQTQCPSAAFCNDRFLMACSATTGVTLRAECKTSALCECALTNSCPKGVVDGCGVPVCGDTMANFRCTDAAGTAAQGPLLQTCKPGRDGWATTPVTDCKSAALCYPGTAPSYMGGYCATCPVAGEVACDGSSTRMCSADRKSWTGQTNCGFGCVADASTTDYCAACMVDERRCSGDAKQLLACSADRKTTPVLQDCPFGCINSGTADFCAACGLDEKRCDGSTLRTCAADRKGFGASTACPNGCFEEPGVANDRCMDCVPGRTECSGAGHRTCGIDGRWGAVTSCAEGCAVSADGRAFCRGCQPNELRCAGDAPGSALQQCAADLRSLTTVETCAEGCVNNMEADYCAVCRAGELRCNDNTLQTCTMDRTGLIDSQNCTNECHDSGTADYCGVCRPGASRCGTAASTRQICGADGRWADAVACTNDTACYGTAPNAYCGDCKPGDTRCSGTSILTCGNDGRWPTTSTETCSRGCIDNGERDYCALCSPGDTTCAGATLLSCDASGRYPATGMACDKGCVGTAPAAECAQCSGTETNCSGQALQSCVNGRFRDLETCSIACVTSTGADFCADCATGAAECVDNNTSRRVCASGRWADPVACPNNACVGTECAACTPNDVQCANSNSYRTCSANGTWGMPTRCADSACFNDACVECMPSTEECADASHLRTCSATGSWQAPEACASGSCLNNECVDCVPNATQCVDSQRQRTCNANGRWGMAMACDAGACVGTTCADCMPGEKQCNPAATQVSTCSPLGQWLGSVEACDNGCVDNGMADYCQACADGASECLDTMTLRVCDGGWMMSPCARGCFDATGSTDYCRDCSVGASECVDETHYRACDDAGHWGASTVCANHCLETTGTCVACKPGTTMCQDAENQLLCGSSGSWSDPDPCPNGCVGDKCAPPAEP